LATVDLVSVEALAATAATATAAAFESLTIL
jgi:hypothetical protein